MIGKPIPRVEDQRFVTGNGQYTDDIRVDGQLHAAFLRSPHAHAGLRSVDISAAQEAPGVIAVLVGQDYLDDGFQGVDHVPNPVDAVDATKKAFLTSLTGSIFNQFHIPLPVDRVRYVGEAIAMVIAETPLQARNASELIEVDYDVLDAVINGADAMQPDAPQLWDGAPGNLCFQTQIGDREAARKILADADHVIRREFHHSRLVNCQMEPRSAIGMHDAANDVYTLISGSQGAVRQQLVLAAALKVPPARMRVVCPDTGGGFGPRSFVYVEQLAVVWAARRVGRPVKWTSDRSEAFLSDYQGRDAIIRSAIGFSKDGRILAIDNEWIGNVGAHTVSYVPMSNGTRIMTTVYDVPVAAVHVSAVMTNTVPTAPYRGAGRPEATHVIERMLDLAAAELGIDRAEIRRRNLVTHDKLPYRSPMGLTYDSGEFERNMARAMTLAQWDSFEERRAQSRANGRLRGIGLANYIESPVGAPRERIELTVRADGSVDIVSGTQSTGQGHETTFAQVIAHHLGVPMEAVKLRTGDTAFVSVGGGSHSDRTMRLGGMLLVDTAQQIIATGKQVAAALFGVDASGIEYADASFTASASGKRISLAEVAHQVSKDGVPGDPSMKKLYAHAEVNTRVPAHPTGAAICELEVDPDTGMVELVNYTSVDDVGQPINPLIVEGQVHGGLAQGIGQALSEGFYVDRETGQVLTGSYMDYGMPRAGVIPPLNVELTEDPTHGNPLRVKGGGESGITPATATIFNALADALREYGNDELAMPATPKVVWEYIHRAQGGAHVN
ncbi:xanthine dehydrogenase family protein molybdopterin-binding subunit [Paraburkholderia hospita]|uniref:Xanthine dehydrogenase family protein molybdopterin-binding subunit n=1 Tax=Paraburkholderia hospita TaxID=169430 RepID=A0AAN1MND0_9BURK|nr:xanthine dehydrogenase family protein molybdopterin-binding subunit [Paraburkholderia hospita]AUT73525.1 xanthine dehydrogenase family protein molybdopterin-binding subunit [Paraburkholderia hospita]EIM99018.1 xanthine dehydrogenase, molybdenum binding subunit apoprotein [Paraburkholderia hospita]OUL75275.1 xanthine dehydrogenase [Paraburkholderia hospita]OUL94480.1 xanthine dehydrogenase [Paraburkholderia hospita]SEH74967.1 xanthine dehydrogenase, molybdenum binding subunit apoprotein [Par